MSKRMASTPCLTSCPKKARVKRLCFTLSTKDYLANFEFNWMTLKSPRFKPSLTLKQLARQGSVPSAFTYHQRYGKSFVDRVCCWNRLDGHRMAVSGRWSGYFYRHDFFIYHRRDCWGADNYCNNPLVCRLAEEYETRLAQKTYTFADYRFLYESGPGRTLNHLINADYSKLSPGEKLEFFDHCRVLGEHAARGELTEALLGDFLVRRNIARSTRWYDNEDPDPQTLVDNNETGKYPTVQLFNGAEIPADFTVYDPAIHSGSRWLSRFPFESC